MNDDVAVTPRFPERADEPLINAVRRAKRNKGTIWEWPCWVVVRVMMAGAAKD